MHANIIYACTFCQHTSTHTHARARTRTHTHTRIRTYTHIHTLHKCTHTYTRAHRHAYIHTYTQPHMCTLILREHPLTNKHSSNSKEDKIHYGWSWMCKLPAADPGHGGDNLSGRLQHKSKADTIAVDESRRRDSMSLFAFRRMCVAFVHGWEMRPLGVGA